MFLTCPKCIAKLVMNILFFKFNNEKINKTPVFYQKLCVKTTNNYILCVNSLIFCRGSMEIISVSAFRVSAFQAFHLVCVRIRVWKEKNVCNKCINILYIYYIILLYTLVILYLICQNDTISLR